MTVKELIDKLLDCPLYSEVVIFDGIEGRFLQVKDCGNPVNRTIIFSSNCAKN